MHDAPAFDVTFVPPASLKDNLAFTIEQAGLVSGIGRSAVAVAVRDGRLSARKCGRRTVVLRADLQAFLSALPAATPSGV